MHPFKEFDPRSLPSAARGVQYTQSREEKLAEVDDAYGMGWDAGDDLDNPPPCPFRDGINAKLWRQGFAARVDAYIAKRRSAGGLHVSLT